MASIVNKLRETTLGDAHAEGKASNWVPVLEQPIFTRRKLRIVCIGAGLSGLTLAHKIKHEFKVSDDVDFTIYERNHDVGGTWLENTYPGAACDIPAHCYTLPFAPNPNWSKFMAPGHEIHAYIKDTVAKFGLDEHIQFKTKVQETVWDEESGKWKIIVEQDGKVKGDEADILINAAGFLNKWKWPAIEGLNDFKGKLVHTANWDNDYEWAGKKVAVIGNGSSAIQCVPAMQPKVAHLHNYIRSPTWVSPNFAADPRHDGKNFTYSEEEKELYRTNPEAFRAYLKGIEHQINMTFHLLQKDSPLHQMLQGMCRDVMQARMKDSPELAAKMIPDFAAGCRRLSPGDGYLEALQEKNVTPEWNSIIKFTENGILTEKGEEKFDMIVCATGFDTTWTPQWKLVGRDGKTLDKTWAVGANPEAFLGINVEGMPNYFMMFGPNSPVGNGSVLRANGWACDWIMRTIEKIAKEDIKSIVIQPQAIADYSVYSQELLKRTVWSDHCRAWYKSGKTDGNVTGVYPGSTLHFKDLLENIGYEHFNFTYNSANRFRFMGNANSIKDEGGMGDLAYYM